MFEYIYQILQLIDDENERMLPPTVIYNEKWMLRLVMKWFLNQSSYIVNSDLDRKIVKGFKFDENANCYSEATIQTPFKKRKKGVKDKLAEASSTVSGVIGHIKVISKKNKEKVVVSNEANQFNVFEVFLYDELYKGTKTLPKYNQVARVISCLVYSTYKLENSFLDNTGLYIIAPREQLKLSSFKIFTERDKIEEIIRARVEEYKDDEEKKSWLDYFNRVFMRVEVECISWEDIILFIKKNDSEYGDHIRVFYDKCLLYNS